MLWERALRRMAAGVILAARTEAYLDGLHTGRAERPMTCGLSARDHCSHSYLYDPGQ